MRDEPCRYQRSIESAIAAADTAIAADCYRAEMACYFARQGKSNEARSITVSMREKYARSPNAAISAWLSLAEGLDAYFLGDNSVARDKIRRAHALSMAAGVNTLQPLSSAWFCQIEFSALNIQELIKHATVALSLSTETNHSALSRVSLVVAQVFHVAGRFELALPWYRRAHRHATVQGDDATVSALIHNMACMHLDNLRQQKLTGRGADSDVSRVAIEVDSTKNFDELIGATSFQSLKSLLRGRAFSLSEKPEQALECYSEHMLLNGISEFSRMSSDVLSDIAWCRIQLNQPDLAFEAASGAESSLLPETQIDDRAATHTRLSWFYERVGLPDRALIHREQAGLAWASFVQMQETMLTLLKNISVVK